MKRTKQTAIITSLAVVCTLALSCSKPSELTKQEQPGGRGRSRERRNPAGGTQG